MSKYSVLKSLAVKGRPGMLLLLKSIQTQTFIQRHLWKNQSINNKKKPIHTTFLDNIDKNNSLPNQNYGQSEYTLEVVEKLKKKLDKFQVDDVREIVNRNKIVHK